MKNHTANGLLLGLLAVGFTWIAGGTIARGQYTQNRETVRIDTSSYPPTIRNAYRVFSNKCGECHTLDLSLKPSFSPVQWNSIIKQMQARPSSHINDSEAKVILDFLTYDESHRKARTMPANSSTGTSESVAAGRQFYIAQGCDACHSIAGNGGSAGPALDDVGSKLSRDRVIAKLKGIPPSQTMPPLPAGTTKQQINDLADYLLTLRKN